MEEEGEGLWLNDDKVSVWGDEKLLATDSDNGCTTLKATWNHTPKMVKMANVILHTFYHNIEKILTPPQIPGGAPPEFLLH